jgi:hypothetical protein
MLLSFFPSSIGLNIKKSRAKSSSTYGHRRQQRREEGANQAYALPLHFWKKSKHKKKEI